MIARPILMSAPMVRGLLNGTKSQTRRIVKPQPNTQVWLLPPGLWMNDRRHEHGPSSGFSCPYGKPGDLLWVRESFSRPYNGGEETWYWVDGNPQDGDWWKPQPSIHMHRFRSRLTRGDPTVRIERLQDISEEDAVAEVFSSPTTGAASTRAKAKLVAAPHQRSTIPRSQAGCGGHHVKHAVSWFSTPRLRQPVECHQRLRLMGYQPLVLVSVLQVHRCNIDQYLKGEGDMTRIRTFSASPPGCYEGSVPGAPATRPSISPNARQGE